MNPANDDFGFQKPNSLQSWCLSRGHSQGQIPSTPLISFIPTIPSLYNTLNYWVDMPVCPIFPVYSVLHKIYTIIYVYIYYTYTCIFIWYSYLISLIMVMFYTTYFSVNPHLYSPVNVYIDVVFTHHECRSFYPWEKSAFHIFLFVYPTITILENSMYGIFRRIFTNICPNNHQNVGK